MISGLMIGFFVAAVVNGPARAGADWLYNGGPAGDHYAEINQIDASNVGRLKQVWRFDFEDGGLQAQPLVIDGVLYGPTPSGKLVALDAASGKVKWTFDPGVGGAQPIRGVVAHGEGRSRRLLFATQNFLYAIDVESGKPISTFGSDGRIDLNENLRGPASQNGMFVTTPGSVFEDLYIVSGRVSESTPSSPGDIRAFDVLASCDGCFIPFRIPVSPARKHGLKTHILRKAVRTVGRGPWSMSRAASCFLQRDPRRTISTAQSDWVRIVTPIR